MRREQWLEILDGGWWDTTEAIDDLRLFGGSLKWHGLYEQYLLRTWREQSHDITPDEMVDYLKKCNRKRLLAAGDPIRVTGKTVTLYRGVSGDSIARGISWTDDLNIACVFAQRYSGYPTAADWATNPTVYKVTVPLADVLCYTNGKGEREYLLNPTNLNPEVVPFKGQDMYIRKLTHIWDDRFVLRERFADTDAFLKSQGIMMEASAG